MNKHAVSLAQYVICMGAFLSNLAAGMFNIALVDMAADFQQPLHSTQWVITVYLLTISICLPLMGRLGDLRGKRSIHNGGFLLFMLGSLCCALSPNLPCLILFRALQGVGASMYQATNMALIVSLFPPERRGRALGLISTFVAAGSMVGPSLGGVLVQWFSWHMDFWLLALISLTIWLLARRWIPKDLPAGSDRLDGTGAVLFATALTGLIAGLSMGSSWGWHSLPVLLLLVLFAISLCGFILWSVSPRWEKSGRTPFIQLGLFASNPVRWGIVITIVTYMAVFSAQIAVPVFLRHVLHLQPALAGLIMMGYPASLFFSSPLSGGFSDRIGAVPLVCLGLGCMIVSLLALGLVTPGTGMVYVVVFILLLGCSMGMVTSPNTSLTMGSTPAAFLGLIGSMMALSRNMGMILGAVLGGSMMSLEAEGEAAIGMTADQAVSGFRAVFLVAAVLVAAVSVLTVVSVRRRGKEQQSLAS